MIANFTTGPGATTLPIRIYSEVRLGVKPEINAVCTIFVAVIALVVIAASILTRRAERRQHASASRRFAALRRRTGNKKQHARLVSVSRCSGHADE